MLLWSVAGFWMHSIWVKLNGILSILQEKCTSQAVKSTNLHLNIHSINNEISLDSSIASYVVEVGLA
ncbi:hypothetical protein NMG60_11006968 [Bertholletia excelsa]